ncbi:MAG TPA: hypothetical protein VMF11_03980 [Candidatus Baltobacteraceae bacterium]|nr:hypothetical protein [Candidatus Baltobacteraceae bacterium]
MMPLLALVASTYGNLTMREVGPAIAGGRIAAVAGTPQNDKLYYIGSAGGGVWKSENGGATWSPVFDDQRVSAIGAVAIDPRNANVVWVGTGEANPRNDVSYGDGLYKTTDGGKHWKRAGLAGVWSISRIAVDPKDPQHVVVAAFGDPFKDSSDRGVYVTFNGGRTFAKTLYVDQTTGASDLAMNPQDPSVVYAGMWPFRRKPWTFTSGGPDGGLFKSTDGGKSWKKLTGNGLPPGSTGRIGLALAPSDPKRVYAVIEAKGGILWRSDDAGAHWKMVSDDTLVDQRPFYFSHLAVDPRNPDHVYAVSEMLAESKDGGKKFEAIAKDVHVDYHAMWIAPNDPDRMMTGEDGGYALTLDGGKTWSFSQNVTVGEIYHVGYSLGENPYLICAALQDNEAFCGPSNSLSSDGIVNSDWFAVVGGDGEWAIPDPSDSRYIWSDLEDGVLMIYDRKAQTYHWVRPYDAFPAGALGPFDSREAKYRFNWDSPLAFAPWDGHTAWFGGDVVFQTTDRGEHWTVISPDLTRNIKDHQRPAGGPLAEDVSGAEYSDTLLDIEGSPIDKGEIWTGSDDGVVSLTRDGGEHWETVTPKGAPEFARFETVAPSPLEAGTAYAIADDHLLGDYAPFVYVTHDYGKTWTSIVNGLPADQYARTVRPDLKNPDLVYAGTENGMWISYDSGAHWENFKLNMPTVSVRDIRIQPEFDDLLVGTHGHDLYVLDDLSAVQQLPQAQKDGVMLFKPRTSYEYHQHSNQDYGTYAMFAAQNPPGGVIIDYYLSAPQKKAPVIEVADASGKVVRTISGTHKVKGKDVPNVPNKAGINRLTWDFRENGPTQWMGAARPEYRGPKTGPQMVPGEYTVRLVLGGRTLTQTVTVKPDPRDDLTQADYQSAYDFAEKYTIVYGKIDQVLNNLDAIKKSLASAKPSGAALQGDVAKANAQWGTIFSSFTADFHNDEDQIQRPGSLREEIPRTGFGAAQPPTAEQLDYASRFDTAYAAAMARYNDYVTSLQSLSKRLQASGAKPIDGAKNVSP